MLVELQQSVIVAATIKTYLKMWHLMKTIIQNEDIFGEYIDQHLMHLSTKNHDNPFHQSQDKNK